MPGVVEENAQDAVNVPPDTKVALVGHVAMSTDGAEALRLTGPERPNKLVKVTVLVPEEPAANETDVADIL